MEQSSHRDGRLTEGQIGIKDEYEQKLYVAAFSHLLILTLEGSTAFQATPP